MFNGQHEKQESVENTEESMTNQNSSSDSPPTNLTVSTTDQPEVETELNTECINDSNVLQGPQNTFDPFLIKAYVKEVREIVQTVEKAVFCIIGNNFDQLANRSSNTFGMRVKDSLILKIQQSQKKEIPFDALKTSLVCQMIVDDDVQIRFLPRIKSPAPSSGSGSSSTKQRKSVSLAEEVKVFNQSENAYFFAENEADFHSELMDSHNDRNMESEDKAKSDEIMCDFISQKSSTSPAGSESLFFNDYNKIETAEKSESFVPSDAEAPADKTDEYIFENWHKNSLIKITTSIQDKGIEGRETANSEENPTILPGTNLISDGGKKLQKKQPSDYSIKEGTELIEQGKERISKRSKTVNQDNDKASVDDDEQKEQVDLTGDKDQKKSSSFHASSHIFHKSPKKSQLENVQADDVTVSRSEKNGEGFEESKEENDQKSCDMDNMQNAYLHLDSSNSENARDNLENNGRKDKFFPSESLIITMDNMLSKLDQNQPALEINDVDAISEKGIASINFSAEKFQSYEDISKPEERFNFQRSPDVDQKIDGNDKMSEEKERTESSSGSKLGDKDKSVGNENMRLPQNSGGYKFFKKTFATANVESKNLIRFPITSLVQKKSTNKHKNGDDVTVAQDANSDDERNKPQTRQGDEKVDEKNCKDDHDINPRPEDDPDLESSDTRPIESNKSEVIVASPEKRPSLFSRIVKSKNRSGNNIASDEIVANEEKQSEAYEVSDPLLETNLREAAETSSTCEPSEGNKLDRKNSKKLQKVRSQQLGELALIDEKRNIKSTCDTKTSSPANDPSSNKTSEKVSLKANKLLKQSSGMDSSVDQRSMNDLSLKQTSSKVLPKTSKSSRKLSMADTSDVVRPDPNNPAAETVLVFAEQRILPNENEAIHVAEVATSKNELELTKKLKTKKRSGGSLKKMQTQAYPCATDNILQLDPLIVGKEQRVDKIDSMEIDKVEIKPKFSGWSMRSKKSSGNLKGNNQAVSEKEELVNDSEDSAAIDVSRNSYNAKEPMRRKKSMLNVASRSLLDDEGFIRANLQSEGDPDIIENEKYESFSNDQTSKPRNKSDSTLVALQLYPASINTNSEQLDQPLEPSVNVKKRNRFIEGLKRSLQSEKNRAMKSERKSEGKLKVSSLSQTDMDKELTPESLTDLKDGNDVEKSTRSSHSLDTELSQSSATMKKDILIGGIEETGSLLLKDHEDTYPKQKSRSFKRFFKRSTEKNSKMSDITDPDVENVIPKSISDNETSKQLIEETPKNIVELYSVAIDSDKMQNNSSLGKITDLSSKHDHDSQDLAEKNSRDVNECDAKSVLKLSEDLKSKPVEAEKDDFSLKVNKSFARLWQKISLKDSNKETSNKCSNDDDLEENKDFVNDSNEDNKSSKQSIRSVQKKSRKEMKTMKGDTVNGDKHFVEKSEYIESQKTLEPDSKNEMNKVTIGKHSSVISDKPESVVIAYVAKPSVEAQLDGQIIIRDGMQSDSILIENKKSEEQSDDSVIQAKERHSLFSEMKSIFKSLHKSQSRKRSIASIEEPENTHIAKHSLRENELRGSASGLKIDEKQSVHFMKESVEMAMIQSTKSLQDNRKRSKSRRKSGHKIFGDEEIPFVTANLDQKSYQATTQKVNDRTNHSDEFVAESNADILLTGEERVVEKPAEIFDRRTKSKNKEQNEGNTKKFAVSLSRIFSNSSRKRILAKEPKVTTDSQTNPEDHFEITTIPLSSSDDSSTQENDCKIANEKSDVTENNREELVAIKSLDSTHGSDIYTAGRESIVKRSSKVSELKYTTQISNDQLLDPEQSGTFIFSAPKEVNQISSTTELTTKHSLKDVLEIRKPSEKIYVAKGTVVSYAPMVESAKYISDERDDISTEEDQSDKPRKRSSGKSFATIRKLFSRGSMRSRQDPTATEDPVDIEGKQDSLKSGKSSIIKTRESKDHSVDQLNDDTKRESKPSAIINLTKSTKDKNDEDNERNSQHGLKKQMSKSKVNIRQLGAAVENIEGSRSPVALSKILLVNNLELSRSKNCINDGEDGLKPAAIKSSEANIVANKVEVNHGGLKPTDIVEHVVVDEIIGLKNAIDVEQKESQRSKDIKKDSLLSAVKSYMSRRVDVEKKETEDVKLRGDEKSEDSITLASKDSKKTLKQQSISKTQSAFSRGMKRLFKKRSSVADSVASNKEETVVEDPADDRSQSLNVKILSDLSTNASNNFMVETETCDQSRKNKTKDKSDDKQFTVYNAAASVTKYPANNEESSAKLKDKNARPSLENLETSKSKSTVSSLRSMTKTSLDALSKARSESNKLSTIDFKDNEIESARSLPFPERHTAISFSTLDNPESETGRFKNVGSSDFRISPSFASKRPTVVMMATPDPPRNEQQNEESGSSNHPRDGSSSSPTAFYYLLGPSLDEALVDVRVVFQNLIDKITGRSR